MANGDNIFGETSGVDLTAVVNPINLNPLDIFGKDYSEKLKTIDTWNRFQSWLRISASSILISQGILSPGQVIRNNPILNSRAKGKPISDRIIDNYNITNPQYPITLVDIQNIQLFHQKVNPSVQVDEWVGSQTTQLSYPSPTTYAVVNNFNPPKDYRARTLNNNPATLPYFPIIWGNKRFIISRENWDKGVINDPLGSKIWIQKYLDPNYFILYNNEPIYEILYEKSIQELKDSRMFIKAK
jgi:hypothetical protein